MCGQILEHDVCDDGREQDRKDWVMPSNDFTGHPTVVDPCALGVKALGALYRAGSLSPVEATRSVWTRIEQLNPELRAYLSVAAESSLATARAAELQFEAGIDLGPMHGIPISVKDNIAVMGTRTTAASRVLFDAPFDQEDAEVIRRLRAGGAVIVGKTNTHEFALGAPDEEGPFGNVQNPRKLGHQAGSSSSGAAAAIAAGLGALAVGTDTGGSVRHPAGLYGVVNIKPTHGLISMRGVVPMSYQLDHVGLIGRSVADVAAGLTVAAGLDPLDPHSAAAPHDEYLAALGRDVRGLRLALPTNDMYQFGSRQARTVFDRAHATLGALGVERVAIVLPRAEELNDIYLSVMGVDMLSYHETLNAPEDLYGRDMRKRMAVAREVSATRYARALMAKDDIRRAWLGLFEQVDLLAVLSNVSGAPAHGVEMIEIEGAWHPARMVSSPFSRGFSTIGFPAIVIPIGEMLDGLPIGIQLVGPPFSESRLFAVADALERALGDLVGTWGIDVRPRATGIG